ncbi:OsmC family protein [Candidatus Viadribacter manganicus]|uniref:Peroxiredoxin n=1 Tax=Candidatus Viadribacter manganicus TaxID=1759059 RepID=A0A1B1AKR3_9PROT|nr:OsmC family protein [Candidatus Viadribacter manganicus]ANP47162.1 peroxiredoxin [Candidatus Viadribacter manganicus]
MATYTATVVWARGDQPFTDGQYSRAHEISFDGGTVVPGSSSPHVVKLPLSREDAVDPEEMLVASLSTCHMLFVLDFARRAGFVVDSYIDQAEGVMGKDDRGKIAVTQVKLNPIIEWSGDKQPTPEEVRELHHKSHEACFIANSFRGDVAIAEGEAH